MPDNPPRVNDPIPAKEIQVAERIAQITAHRACCGSEHDPKIGRLHGYCVVCGVPWPCAYAGTPPSQSEADRSAVIEKAAYFSCRMSDLSKACRGAEDFILNYLNPARRALRPDMTDKEYTANGDFMRSIFQQHVRPIIAICDEFLRTCPYPYKETPTEAERLRDAALQSPPSGGEKRETSLVRTFAPNKTLEQLRPGPFMHFHQDGPHLGFKSEYHDEHGVIAYNEAGERFHGNHEGPYREVEFDFAPAPCSTGKETVRDHVACEVWRIFGSELRPIEWEFPRDCNNPKLFYGIADRILDLVQPGELVGWAVVDQEGRIREVLNQKDRPVSGWWSCHADWTMQPVALVSTERREEEKAGEGNNSGASEGATVGVMPSSDASQIADNQIRTANPQKCKTPSPAPSRDYLKCRLCGSTSADIDPDTGGVLALLDKGWRAVNQRVDYECPECAKEGGGASDQVEELAKAFAFEGVRLQLRELNEQAQLRCRRHAEIALAWMEKNGGECASCVQWQRNYHDLQHKMHEELSARRDSERFRSIEARAESAEKELAFAKAQQAELARGNAALVAELEKARAK